MTHLERIRLNKREQQTAQWIGTPYVLLGKVAIKILWKMKRWLMIFALAAFVMYGYSNISVSADSPKANLTSPIIASPTPTSEQQQIIDYINQVFGPDAPKAFQLLHGTPKCPGENGSLNPNAVNDNRVWGGVGRDFSIFQINDTWQKVQPKFLLNWHINIQIAYQLYVENGHRFNLWTSGRCQGI